MCLRINRRSTISAGAPSLPRLRLLGCRLASASYTAAITASSASTWSACLIQSSRRSLTSSQISPSPKLSCARRISITPLSPRLSSSRFRTQQIVIELADRLDRLLQLLVIGQPLADLGNPLATDAELARATAWIAHRQHRHSVALAALALRAAAGMMNDSIQQRTAQQLTGWVSCRPAF